MIAIMSVARRLAVKASNRFLGIVCCNAEHDNNAASPSKKAAAPR